MRYFFHNIQIYNCVLITNSKYLYFVKFKLSFSRKKMFLNITERRTHTHFRMHARTHAPMHTHTHV